MGYRLHIFLLRNYLPRMFSVCMCAGLQVSVSVLLFLFVNPVPPPSTPLSCNVPSQVNLKLSDCMK